jgi:hypothetical protein
MAQASPRFRVSGIPGGYRVDPRLALADLLLAIVKV